MFNKKKMLKMDMNDDAEGGYKDEEKGKDENDV